MKKRSRPNPKFIVTIVLMLIAFAALMLVFRENMYVNILVTVLLVYCVFFILLKAKNSGKGCRME